MESCDGPYPPTVSRRETFNNELKITEIFCQRPADINQGTVSPSKGKYSAGDVITYVCQSGYKVVGMPTRTCMENKQFDGVAPSCMKGDGVQVDDNCAVAFNQPCDMNAQCSLDNGGNYKCICNSGYTGDGFNCQGDNFGSFYCV